MLFGLLPLIILGGIIALIVRVVGNRGDAVPEAGGIAVRRFFQYALLYAVVIVVAIGATGLLAELIPGEELLRRGTDRNARSLAFLVIGAPVLYGLVRWVRTGLEEEDERRSLAWALYVGTAALTGLITGAVGLYQVGESLLGISDFDSASLARFVVWGAVWWVHFRIVSRHHHAGWLRLHLVGGSFLGLLTIAIAAGGLITAALTSLFDRMVGTTTISSGGGDLVAQASIALAIGVAIWAQYWLITYNRLNRDGLWHGYALLAGVLSGLVTLLVGTIMLLFFVLDWFFGGSAGSAADHFQNTLGTLATIAVGFGIWAYHRAVLRAGEPSARSETERVYEYLVAAVGLLAAAGGVTTILVALIEALLPNFLSNSSSDEALLAAVAILVVSVPVWWRTWTNTQQLRATNPSQELTSPSRRIYILALFGLGGVTALIALLTLAVTMLEDLFNGDFGARTVYSIRVSLALVVTVGAVAAYHWAVRKEDQVDTPAEEAVEHEVRMVVLVSATGREVADEVTTQTGVRVRVWDRPDTESTASVESVVAAIAAGTHPRLLLIADDDGLRALPYTERT